MRLKFCFVKKKISFHSPKGLSAAPAAAKSLQSCPTLCDPIDGSPPDSPIPGILKARTLEWVAISFSSAWKWEVKVKSLSLSRHLQIFAWKINELKIFLGDILTNFWWPRNLATLRYSKCDWFSFRTHSFVYVFKLVFINSTFCS